MKNVEEGSDSITGCLADLCFLDECFVEDCGGIFLLHLFFLGIFAVGLLFGGSSTRNVEAHFYKLISASTRLFALATSTTKLAVSTCVVGVLR